MWKGCFTTSPRALGVLLGKEIILLIPSWFGGNYRLRSFRLAWRTGRGFCRLSPLYPFCCFCSLFPSGTVEPEGCRTLLLQQPVAHKLPVCHFNNNFTGFQVHSYQSEVLAFQSITWNTLIAFSSVVLFLFGYSVSTTWQLISPWRSLWLLYATHCGFPL